MANASKDIQSNLLKIQKELQAYQKARLIAVTKGHSIDLIRILYNLGQRDFGENYVQELTEKVNVLASEGIVDIRWHFLGHLQRNKVKLLTPHLFALHSLDSWELAQALARHGKNGKACSIFVQVNIDQERQKSGLMPEEVLSFVKKLQTLPDLKVEGLMCIPQVIAGQKNRQAFQQMAELSKACGSLTAGRLSMGMSDDYLEALREGATDIRVGTALLGPRPEA